MANRFSRFLNIFKLLLIYSVNNFKEHTKNFKILKLLINPKKFKKKTIKIKSSTFNKI